MKKFDMLLSYHKIAEVQARRLEDATKMTAHLFPLNARALDRLPVEDVALLDMMTTRFSKLQDIIGRKIFPLILDILGEHALSFIDKLNTLEKLEIIDDANWWMQIREFRNDIAYDYPDNYNKLADDFNKLLPLVQQLLDFWQKLPKIIDGLPKNL